MMEHGGDIYSCAKLLGCGEDEIIDFSSNINFYHKKISLDIDVEKISQYPDTNYTKLKSVISNIYDVKVKQIALLNGATSAIYTIFTSIKSKSVYLYAPLYGEYEKAALISKKNVYLINRIEDIYEEPKKNSIVVFVNPATPEATYYDMQKLFKIWKKLKCSVILDESFIEFENLKSYRKYINSYKKLYVVQSFSKYYASAGVRIGAVFSNKENIKNLKIQRWNISSFDSEFLQNRLVDDEFRVKTKELHSIQKQDLLNILESSQLFDEIVPSDANFILTYSPNANNIVKQLLKYKIMVRECESFDFLSEKWLRFAVKDEQSHKELKKALSFFNE